MQKLFALLSLLILISSCSKKEKQLKGSYFLDERQSIVKWKGSAPDHFHVGSFKAKGQLKTDKEGNITFGEFNIPIASIQNDDLPDSLKPVLLNHLKSADFFNIALHPKAVFKLDEAVPFSGFPSDATHMVKGRFTLLGIEDTLSFPARLSFTNNAVHVQAKLSINRLNWGMTSYSDPSGELYILPDVQLELDLTGLR